jgi:hypothetical protein
MHPGYQNPDAIGPSGPVDPDISMLSVQSRDGRPIALLANYSMHYFGSPLVSSDYYGSFCEQVTKLMGADKLTGADRASPAFVPIMSQGTSGDQMWMDYGQPASKIKVDEYAAEALGNARDQDHARPPRAGCRAIGLGQGNGLENQGPAAQEPARDLCAGTDPAP